MQTEQRAKKIDDRARDGSVPVSAAAGPPGAPSGRRARRTRVIIALGVVAILGAGGLMMRRAASHANKVALAAAPVPVSVVAARATTFQTTRAYVATIRPWVEANVGPQLVSAYVDSVLVRPGAAVRRGDVLATLDCRNASTETRAVAAQARAIEARQKALADEAGRMQQLLSGGFVSPNEAEKKLAGSAAEEAQLAAERANLARSSLTVNDCVLRSPFDGEIAERYADPGAFIRPGAPIVTVVDRSTVRVTVDAPESDFDVVAPKTPAKVRVLASGREFATSITRRAPSADAGTRTVHVELDVPDPARGIPVNTTGEVRVAVGEPVPATEVPVYAASTAGEKATLFVADDGVARSRTLEVKGEIAGRLYFAPDALPAGTRVVTEGRALLSDGDRVAARVVDAPELAVGDAGRLP